MTLAPQAVDELAGRLFEAHRGGTLVPGAPSALEPGLDRASAHAVQRTIVDRWTAAGELAIGWKIGLTAAVEPVPPGGPIFGRLLSGMVATEREPIDARRLYEPKIEAEIAFLLDRPLQGPGVTLADALAATRGVLPALEIIASRWRSDPDHPEGEDDFVADNAASAHVVVGGRLTAPEHCDLRLLGMAMTSAGRLVSTGAGARVLGHPAQAVAWLANALAEHGQGIAAGELVLSGSLAAAAPVQPGDSVTAELHGLGTVSARFA